MRLEAVASLIECPYPAFQALPPAGRSPISASSGGRRRLERRYSDISFAFIPNPVGSRTRSSSRKIRRTCSSHLDGFDHGDRQSFRSAKGSLNRNAHCEMSKKVAPFTGLDHDSFSWSRFDSFHGMMPEKNGFLMATVEHNAKSFDIPLSLRMIKKKLKLEQDLSNCKDMVYCPINSAFASMVFIVVKLQIQALIMRETSCQEDLQVVKSKVQKEMHSSFIWMFQQVFSTTPSLMLQVMILVANFSANSASETGFVVESESVAAPKADPSAGNVGSIGNIVPNPSVYPAEDLKSQEEVTMWNSIVDEAMQMKNDDVLNIETMKYFVSPVTIHLEPDRYDEFLRTDLMYQMNLARDPDNSLLLCNYAQFLHLVAHDYDRAEECYKKALHIQPSDTEPLVLYANFLWTIRGDFLGAEERYLQALSINPGSVHYASRYAHFLYNTGEEETCYPLCQY